MDQSPVSLPGVPRWVVICGSPLIVWHLVAVVVGALTAQSGPWPNPEGMNMADPPQFAFTSHKLFQPYLSGIQMTDSYRFQSNRPGNPAAYFTVKLKDGNGEETATLRFPDPNANPWVRHRQGLLAFWLTLDEPVMRPPTETIPAPLAQVKRVQYWDAADPAGRNLMLVEKPETLLPVDRPLLGPSSWMNLVARSYMRHLCRAEGAVSGELVRHHREPIPPAVLFMDNVQADAFDETASNFGEVSK